MYKCLDACPDIATQSPALYAECELLQCSMGSSLVSSARGHVVTCVPPCVASVPSVSCGVPVFSQNVPIFNFSVVCCVP